MIAGRCGGAPRLIGRITAALFVGLFSSAGSAAGQEAAGIVGQVTDESGAVLPGVTVTVSGAALQVQSVTDITNERGEYRVAPLPIGTFAVEYSLSGFQTVRRQDIRLTVGFFAKIDVSLQVGALAETVTVSGASPIVDVSTTNVSTRVLRENLELIPTTRNGVISLLAQAPGARTNIDAGLSVTAVPVFHAFGQDGNAWTLLDGVPMMGPKRNSAGGTPRWDHATIEEVQIQSLGGDADVPTKGIQLTAIIKSGGNDFHGGVFFAGTGSGLQSNNIDADLMAQGITNTGGIQSRYDASGEIGGRIVRDKLWFYGEARSTYENDSFVECFKPDGSVCESIQQQRLSTTKISYQPNPGNRIVGFYHYGYQPNDGTLSRLIPWESRTHELNVSKIGRVGWEAVRGNSLVISAMYGAWRWEQDTEGFSNLPSTLDLTSRVVTGVGNAAGKGQTQYRHGPRFSVSWYKPDWMMGNHAFKAGTEFLDGRSDVRFLINPPGQVLRPAPSYQLQFRQDVPTQILVANGPTEPTTKIQNLPVYLQDNWTVARQVTLGLGLRYEHSATFAPAQCREAAEPPGHVAYPGECYERIEPKAWNAVTPRVRVAWDVTGDGKTAIKGGWSRFGVLRYAENSWIFERNASATSTYRWRDLNNNRDYDAGEVNLDPNGPDFISTDTGAQGSLSAALANVLMNPDETQAISNEYSASIERELMANFGVRATGVYARNTNNYRIQNDLRPYGAYSIPITNPDPGPDGRVGSGDDPGTFITYYDYPVEYAGAKFQQRMYINDPLADQWYKSLELAASKRLSNRWQLIASYSITWKHIPWVMTQSANASNAVDTTEITPNVDINTGDFTSEWLARAQGSYNLPGDVLVSANYEQRSGTPYARTANFTGGKQISSITLNVEPIGTQVLPNIARLELSVRKSFPVMRTRRIEAQVNIFNALNSNGVTALTASSGANYGKATAVLLPRLIEFGGRFVF